MESNGNQNMPPSALCRSGCGFYASASFDGMCSKCYKDALKRKQASSSPVGGGRTSPATSTCGQATSSSSSDSNTSVSVAHATTSTQTPAMPSIETASTTVPTVSTSQSETSKDLKEECETSGAAASPDTDDSSDSPEKDGKKPKKNRCFSCKKKVGLTGFQCRCGGLFCSLHRYSDKHDCQFNYREHGQELIKKQNPVIVGEKIQKI